MKTSSVATQLRGFREDLLFVVSQLQNREIQLANALATDRRSFREMKALVSDLFSLVEVLRDEEGA